MQVASLNQRLTATRLGSGTHVLCAISTGSTQPKSCKIDELVKRQRTVEISSWFLVLSPYPSTSPSSTFLLQEMHLGLFPISITSCLTINTIFYLSFIATITISFLSPILNCIFCLHFQFHLHLRDSGLVSVNSFKFMTKASAVCGKSKSLAEIYSFTTMTIARGRVKISSPVFIIP